jgi:hypothetical protein
MEHAVPNTHDPYTVGSEYLKIYDVKLSDITWDLWKSRFPPAERTDVREAQDPIDFKIPKADKPGEKLVDGYGTDYFPALSSRYWLSSQIDGGELVVAMLKSNVGANGSVNQLPGADMEPMPFPKTTIEDCDLDGVDFQELTVRGLLRRSWIGNKVTRHSATASIWLTNASNFASNLMSSFTFLRAASITFLRVSLGLNGRKAAAPTLRAMARILVSAAPSRHPAMDAYLELIAFRGESEPWDLVERVAEKIEHDGTWLSAADL